MRAAVRAVTATVRSVAAIVAAASLICRRAVTAATAAVTKLALASLLLVSPAERFGAVGEPEKAGEASGAAPDTSATARVTAPVRPATLCTGAAAAAPAAVTKPCACT